MIPGHFTGDYLFFLNYSLCVQAGRCNGKQKISVFCFQLPCACDFVILNTAILPRHISLLVPQVLHGKSLQCT